MGAEIRTQTSVPKYIVLIGCPLKVSSWFLTNFVGTVETVTQHILTRWTQEDPGLQSLAAERLTAAWCVRCRFAVKPGSQSRWRSCLSHACVVCMQVPAHSDPPHG